MTSDPKAPAVVRGFSLYGIALDKPVSFAGDADFPQGFRRCTAEILGSVYCFQHYQPLYIVFANACSDVSDGFSFAQGKAPILRETVQN